MSTYANYPELPKFLQGHKIFSNTPVELCKSEFGCKQPVYDKGLCKVHYALKHLKTEEERSQLLDMDTQRIPMFSYNKQLEEESTMNKVKRCSTENCTRPAVVNGRCYKCQQEVEAKRNAKRLRKIKSLSKKSKS